MSLGQSRGDTGEKRLRRDHAATVRDLIGRIAVAAARGHDHRARVGGRLLDGDAVSELDLHAEASAFGGQPPGERDQALPGGRGRSGFDLAAQAPGSLGEYDAVTPDRSHPGGLQPSRSTADDKQVQSAGGAARLDRRMSSEVAEYSRSNIRFRVFVVLRSFVVVRRCMFGCNYSLPNIWLSVSAALGLSVAVRSHLLGSRYSLPNIRFSVAGLLTPTLWAWGYSAPNIRHIQFFRADRSLRFAVVDRLVLQLVA